MAKTVTRAMLVERAAAASSVSRGDAAHVAERIFDLLAEALMQGESVKLTGFGSLQVRSRAERIGRNPRTGQDHAIAPHQTVIFIPSAKLRDALHDLVPDHSQVQK